jgi:DNA adenine methylase
MIMPRKLHGFASPLRYPGGKGILSNFIKLVISQNRLFDGNYVELYAGGAGIAWPLLFEEYIQHVYINDLSKSIFAFWHSVLYRTDELCRLIQDAPVTMEEWHRQKAIQSLPDQHSFLELGFSTFFLNRTNRSGIIKGGVIGGKSQAGTWKLDVRFNKSDLVSRVENIARYSNRIHIYNLDASKFIEEVLPNLSNRTLVYLDPPYYVKGKGLYENYYTHEDHTYIAHLVTEKIKQPWIVSYDDTVEVENLYKKYRHICYNLSYSAQKKYAGSEIIFFSDDLLIPDVSNPASVKLVR